MIIKFWNFIFVVSRSKQFFSWQWFFHYVLKSVSVLIQFLQRMFRLLRVTVQSWIWYRVTVQSWIWYRVSRTSGSWDIVFRSRPRPSMNGFCFFFQGLRQKDPTVSFSNVELGPVGPHSNLILNKMQYVLWLFLFSATIFPAIIGIDHESKSD